MNPGKMLRAACLGLAAALSACTSGAGHPSSAVGAPADSHGMVISVGSFDFPESVLLAQVYGQRTYCLQGLRRAYGLHFKAFIALDAGGPLTLQALRAGDIGVALLFTTDPNISARHLVVLADDRALQPAENITPVVGREVVARYGTRMLTLINAMSARLTTGSVRSFDAQVVLDGRRPHSVAGAWLRAQGLMQTGGVAH